MRIRKPDWRKEKLTICIDAGHGGKDNGSDYRLRYEKNDNLKIAQAVAAYLAAQEDVQVILTRSDDTFYHSKRGQILQMRTRQITLFPCTGIPEMEMG